MMPRRLPGECADKWRKRAVRQIYNDTIRALNNLFRERKMPYVAGMKDTRQLVVLTGGGKEVFRVASRSRYAPGLYLPYVDIDLTDRGAMRAFNSLFYGSLDMIAEFEAKQK